MPLEHEHTSYSSTYAHVKLSYLLCSHTKKKQGKIREMSGDFILGKISRKFLEMASLQHNDVLYWQYP